MNNPSISIIVPVYHVEAYIADCLKSVAAQTYKGTIECLIVDDCGTDNSMTIANDFVNSYSGNIKFKIINREKNGGISATRNTGIRNASCEYLYFLDSDDYIMDNTIESIVSTCIKYPDADIVLSGHTKIDGTKEETYTLNPDVDYIDSSKILSTTLYAEGNMTVLAWNKLVKRSWLQDNNLYFDENRIAEDVMWTFKTIINKPSIAYNHAITYVYRVRANSIMTSLKDKEKYLQFLDSQMQNYVDMTRMYAANGEGSPLLLSYILWFKFDVLRQAKLNHCKTKDILRQCRKAKEAVELPLSKMPAKHIFFELCLRRCPIIVALFFSSK